ncbi:RagB/SusD family nutrient uptake outer membrane protein [Chryseobacterium sediminis]|uniref:RagB/SusD family nutrient uptake outer membrane protein n=1 Tax=Chryseobacterium sediminis TaxID=1679494 RepID=A0A5B2U8S0_9FLAO|nr:RagB/SusD family nutrient uptake outer membrane protein [Chryseobacterium sediminis]KAA2222952.1 RagB/SusD family nutrient uptake outer membrane protein [Chryseobacterium sediminis]
MKLYKQFYIITGFLILNNMSSCEKLIEVELPSNQIASDQVFVDVQTADAALAGLYSGLRDNSPFAGDQSGRLLGLYTDDLDFYSTTATNGLPEISQNLQNDSNVSIYTDWSTSYKQIYVANAILEGIEKSKSISQADRNRIKGEALMVRSMLLLYLQQVYGDIPYPTTTDYQVNQSISKTDKAQVLIHLSEDLKESISLLQDNYRNTERIFPNRKMAELLLTKVYLLEGRWGEAEFLLKGIIQSPMYQFQNDITKVFIKSGSHILWQLKPKNSGDGTKESGIYYFNNSAPSMTALSTGLVNAFYPADLRKQYWMAPVTFNGTTWYRAEKYKNRTGNTTEYSIIARLEEVYLLLAEALVQQNKIDEALFYLNKTRQRAAIASLALPLSKEEALSEIILENRREFFTEMGHRFFDLKRVGKLDTSIQGKPNWKSFHKLWPIPQQDILLNPNLKPQNEGY